MTYYGGRELAASFRTVRKNTMQIAEEIPESQYGYRVTPDTRSVAATLVHVAFAPRVAEHAHGGRVDDYAAANFKGLFERIRADEARSRSKPEILALLAEEGERFASFLEPLTEPFLAEPVKMFPGAQPAIKTRFELLLAPKEHEMHHRAQLMVVERLIGLVPHLTRQMQARMAEIQAAQQQAQ